MVLDAFVTLESLADACGACASELSIGVQNTLSSPPLAPKASSCAENPPSIPSRASATSIAHSFQSPADDGECANLLRISRVVVEKSSPDSLNLLEVPEAIQPLAVESLESITQECAAIGEQILAEEVTHLLLKIDSRAPAHIVHSFQTILTSTWMLGAYAMHCGFDGSKLYPPLAHDEVVEEELQPMADIVLALIGMAFVCAGRRPHVIHPWIEQVVLPWSIEVTAYLSRLAARTKTRKPVAATGNPRKRKHDHVGIPSQLRNAWHSGDNDDCFNEEDPALRPFVSVWSLSGSAHGPLLDPTQYHPFVEYLINLGDPKSEPQVVPLDDPFADEFPRKRRRTSSFDSAKRPVVLATKGANIRSRQQSPVSISVRDLNLNDRTNVQLSPAPSNKSLTPHHPTRAETRSIAGPPPHSSRIATPPGLDNIAIKPVNYSSPLTSHSASATSSVSSQSVSSPSNNTLIKLPNDHNACTPPSPLLYYSHSSNSPSKSAPAATATRNPGPSQSAQAVSSAPLESGVKANLKRGRPAERSTVPLPTPRTPKKPRRSGSRGASISPVKQAVLGIEAGAKSGKKSQKSTKSFSLRRLALETSHALRVRCESLGSIASSAVSKFTLPSNTGTSSSIASPSLLATLREDSNPDEDMHVKAMQTPSP